MALFACPGTVACFLLVVLLVALCAVSSMGCFVDVPVLIRIVSSPVGLSCSPLCNHHGLLIQFVGASVLISLAFFDYSPLGLSCANKDDII